MFKLALITSIIAILLLTACQNTPISLSQPGSSPTATNTIITEDVVTGLNIPWSLAFAPDGRIFVTERPGTIRVIRNGQLEPEPWIELNVADVGEAGLLGITLDPGFTENGYVYVAYTYEDSQRNLKNRLVRLKEDASNQKGLEDVVIMDNVPGNGTHDGGRVKIGPDNKLYWTMGDAQSPQMAQEVASLNGQILR